MKPRDMSWSRYIRIGVGRRLSQLGEKLGIDSLVYNPIHFAHFHEEAVANAKPVIDSLLQIAPDIHRAADIGSGSGAYAAYAQKLGINMQACEHSPTGRKWAARQGVDCRKFDLAVDPPSDLSGTFDLAWCFEVAEHLPPALGDNLVRFLTRTAPIIAFSAAHPGQGGTGHINEQPKAYWIERFEKNGHVLSETKTAKCIAEFAQRKVPADWLHKNIQIFEKPNS